MERQLFDWLGWDGDQECMIFYNTTLKENIKDLKIGQKFDSIAIVQKDGFAKLEFYIKSIDKHPSFVFKLHYLVGEQLK